MRIGILSDTHNELHTTRAAVRVFESLDVDLVIHCGDIGSKDIFSLFSAWPLHFVFGNMDDPKTLREAVCDNGHTCYERFGHLKVAGRSIAFLHGDDSALLQQTVRSGQWDVVCYGHTHVAAKFSAGPTLVVNPGAIQRTSCPSVAVLDLPSCEVTQIDI